MANILNRIAVGQKDRSLRRELESLMGSVIGRGSCHHPDGTARFVASTLRTFSADVEAHFTGHCVRCHGI
jgi:NADH:ubiquinone oxidoreductase subunit F (NADH-binding)